MVFAKSSEQKEGSQTHSAMIITTKVGDEAEETVNMVCFVKPFHVMGGRTHSKEIMCTFGINRSFLYIHL